MVRFGAAVAQSDRSYSTRAVRTAFPPSSRPLLQPRHRATYNAASRRSRWRQIIGTVDTYVRLHAPCRLVVGFQNLGTHWALGARPNRQASDILQIRLHQQRSTDRFDDKLEDVSTARPINPIKPPRGCKCPMPHAPSCSPRTAPAPAPLGGELV